MKKWFVDKTVVLCKGFLKNHGMACSGGKKGMTSGLHGRMNEENLNGCMAQILVGCSGLNFNNDIQIPYRFPIIEEIHDASVCTEKCQPETDGVE